jgi:hypothetical protein
MTTRRIVRHVRTAHGPKLATVGTLVLEPGGTGLLTLKRLVPCGEFKVLSLVEDDADAEPTVPDLGPVPDRRCSGPSGAGEGCQKIGRLGLRGTYLSTRPCPSCSPVELEVVIEGGAAAIR